jgi:hypothetical protein
MDVWKKCKLALCPKIYSSGRRKISWLFLVFLCKFFPIAAAPELVYMVLICEKGKKERHAHFDSQF